MSGAYVYTPDIWPAIASAIFLAVLSLHSWRHRSMPAALPLAAGSLLGALWLLGIGLEAAAVAPATKIAWHRFQAALQLPAVTATTCFALEYAYPGRWLTRRNVTLLALPPLLALLIIVINDGQFAWRRLEIGPNGSVLSHLAAPGAVLVGYGLSLGLVNAAAFLWLFIRSPQHRWPVAMMLFGEIAGRGLYVLNVARLPSPPRFDPVIISILLDWTMYAIALFGSRILDPLAAARATAIRQMREGMVVFDDRWRVVSVNPAAESILGAPAGRARGKTLQELPLRCPDLGPPCSQSGAGPTEVSLGSGPEARHYATEFSPLRDRRGLIIGHLLLLRDITEQHRAQTRRLAQQWAQATLQEREQLAHELHDGLSQSLAFLNLQAQAAEVYLRAEQREAAQASLARLAEVSREMQGDMRDLIGNLLAVSMPSEGFCSTLRQVVAGFEEQTGLAITLEIEGDADAICDATDLPPAAGLQLLRIVQEALANVRRHAGCPSQIRVRLGLQAEQIDLVIEDNGVGFDAALSSPAGQKFGLQVMRQRAERIGGRIAVHSAPGMGTRVEVRAPLAAGEGKATP